MSHPVARNGLIPLKPLLTVALCVALSVILERFLGYNDRVISISFSYLPVALSGMLFGPLAGSVTCAAADFLGAFLFPSGPLNLWFTLIAALKGALYGVFLHRAGASRHQAYLAQLLVTLIAHLALNTLVLAHLTGRGFLALLPLRLFKNVLFYPIEVFTLFKMSEYRPLFERLLK